MTAKAKEWIIRTASGIVFVAIMLFCILYHQYTAWALFTVIGIGCLWEWYRLMKKTQFGWFFKSVFPLFYIILPIGLAFGLCKSSVLFILLPTFLIIWVNDIMAFVVGSLFGKHKIFPRYSPSKTWEGTIGGIVFSILAGFVWWYFRFDNVDIEWLIYYLVLGGTVALASVFGDLFESYIKRKAGVKDSGKIMPGHGGFLDRFDSFLFALPVAIFVTILIFFKI